jgi:hypothetical protein
MNIEVTCSECGCSLDIKMESPSLEDPIQSSGGSSIRVIPCKRCSDTSQQKAINALRRALESQESLLTYPVK